MGDQKREFKGIWIPAEIWLDERLNALDKIIFAEIDSYSNSDKGCFAGNDYLASFCQCSESKISKTISKLIELGYVKRVSFDGRQRVLQSCIVKFTTLNGKNYDSDQQNLQHNNPLNNPCNNIYNNTPYNPPEGICEEPKKAESTSSKNDAYCNDVVSKFIFICSNLQKPQKLTSKRKRAILKAKKDIEEFGGWEKYFSCIASSDFLNGKNKDEWKAKFDWVLNPDNMVKIMEGNYKNKGRNSNYIPSESDYDERNFFL